MIKETYIYLSPFIAAFLASLLTYIFAIKQKRAEIIIQEKLMAFKALHERLNAIKRYCEAGIAETEGSEFAPTRRDLPVGDDRSALSHATALHYLIDTYRVFLSNRAQQALRKLQGQVGALCGMELAISEDPTLRESGKSGYKPAISLVEECVGVLYTEFKD